jgi:glycosyltransferase involved in cell wall biosynthesis
MKIVIDGRMLYWTGVGRYTQALLENLEQIDSQNEYYVLVRRADWSLWEPKARNFHKIEANIDPYTVAEQFRLVGLIRSLKPDLVHFTAANTPLLYRGTRIVTVHDLTLLDFDTSRGEGVAKQLRRLKWLPFRAVMSNDVRTATAIISATKYVRDELVKRYHVPENRVVTVMLSADPAMAEPTSVAKYGAGKSYILNLGNTYPYKNVSSTIKAFSKITRQFPDLKLVIVGHTDFFSDQLKALAKKLGLTNQVIFTGRISDGEVVSMYRGASLYVNPSLSEGFGLQGLEAMSQGVPVLAANASCLPEVYGDASEYFSPLDVDDQAAKMARLLTDEPRREELRAKGRERLKQFSWSRVAQETLAVYEKVLKS